ncbi:MAG: SulP family inorganic anion transporter [Thermoleophilia bacterium]|nr:SulP family inorganic anion transporter [Thermoleophilia bacterium]
MIATRTLPRRADFPASGSTWRADLIAGITVGVVALPLALGFGIASGVGAAPGLITAIVAGIVAAIFGGSSLQVSGPTGAMTVVLVPIVAEYGAGMVPVLAVLAGSMVILSGWLGLGRAVTLIPWPVVEGFTVGIAVIIFLQQVPLILDVPHAHERNTLTATLHAVQRADWNAAFPAVILTIAAISMLLAARRLRPTFPASLVAVVTVTLLAVAFKLDVPEIGKLPMSGLVAVPDMPPADTLLKVLPAAGVIALLAALESLLSARVADGMSDSRPTDPDRELVGQGLANVASGMFGGLPATGAIARTAVNMRAGAQTRMAALFHGLVLLVVLLGASRIIAVVPLAALAGVLMMTAIRMVDRPTCRALLRADRSDALVFDPTAAMTIVFDLVRAVELGIAVAAILVLRSTARASTVREESVAAHVEHLDDLAVRELLHEHVVVYQLQGSLFFGAAQRFLEELTALDEARVVVLRMAGLNVLDATGAHVLAETVDEFGKRDIAVLLCGVRPQHRRALRTAGIPGPRLPEAHIYADLQVALERARAICHHEPDA